jgi:hypothetical protein
MNIKRCPLILVTILFLTFSSFSQDYTITTPKVEFDGQMLSIKYDLIHKKKSDLFYVLPELKKQSGNPIHANSLSGDFGDSISPGNNKNIYWIPENDAIYLSDTVSIELMAEKYERSFNKSSAMLLSTAFPGLGQTKINRTKAWLVTGVVAYGALAGGLVMRNNYLKTFDTYQTELDPFERSELFDQSQNQKRLSNVLILSAATIWIGNLIWVAATPNDYKPLQLKKLAYFTLETDRGRINMISLNIKF